MTKPKLTKYRPAYSPKHYWSILIDCTMEGLVEKTESIEFNELFNIKIDLFNVDNSEESSWVK